MGSRTGRPFRVSDGMVIVCMFGLGYAGLGALMASGDGDSSIEEVFSALIVLRARGN